MDEREAKPSWLPAAGAVLGLLIGVCLVVWFASCGRESSARRRPPTTTATEPPTTLPPTTTLPPGELEAPVE